MKMETPHRHKAIQERIELLSSPLISNNSSSSVAHNQNSDISDDNCDDSNKFQEEPFKYSRSPLRFRDKVAYLFSSSKKKSPSLVKVEVVAEKSEDNPFIKEDEKNDDKEVLVLDKFKSVAYNDENNKKYDINEDFEEDEAILKFRAVLKLQDQEDKENNSQDCSSEYAEETYLNTLKNQEIPDLPKEEEDDEDDDNETISRTKKQLADLPVSRLFLNIYPEEKDMFKREKDWSTGNYNYALFSIWNKWCPSADHTPVRSQNKERRRKTLFNIGSITNKLELYETIAEYKSNLQKPFVPFEVHLFKEGIKPKKTTKELVDGGILELHMKFSKKKSYKLWKDIVRFVLDDSYVKFVNHAVYELKQRIAGLGFILNKHMFNNGKNIGVVTLKIWVRPMPEEERLSKEILIDLCHLLQEGLPDDLGDHIGDTVFVDNSTSRSHRVFEDN